MSDLLKLITARRSYEFRPDDLRLTMICTQPVQQTIQQAFSFQRAEIGMPLATVEAVPNTIPPGAAFNYGYIALRDGEVTPIRFLHFEPSRIVADVAGTSEAIDKIYEILRQFLGELRAPDGSPAMGEPERVIDYSEIAFHPDTSLIAFLAPGIAEVLADTLAQFGAGPNRVLVPAIRVAAMPAGQTYTGASPLSPDHLLFALEPRAGTKPEAGALFSAASLPTAAHLAYLDKLGSVSPALGSTGRGKLAARNKATDRSEPQKPEIPPQ